MKCGKMSTKGCVMCVALTICVALLLQGQRALKVLLAMLLSGCVFPMGDAFITVNGVVRDELGFPIANASVTLAPALDSDVNAARVSVSTDSNGRFSAVQSYGPPGRKHVFRLTVIREGFQSFEMDHVKDGDSVTVLLRREGGM
jgi:hypothetical protein